MCTHSIFALLITGVLISPALAFSTKDAEYVVGKDDLKSADYVVCLEKETRGSVELKRDLEKATKACRPAAPAGARAEEIRARILECGFKKANASADMACE